MPRCSPALLASLLLCIAAGLKGENSLSTAGVKQTLSNATNLTTTNNSAIASNASSINDTQAKERLEPVTASGETVTPPGPSPSVTDLPTVQHEPSSSTFSTSNSSTSTVLNTGVPSTAGPKSNSSVVTPQVSPAPQTTNSTSSHTSNFTVVTTKPANTAATPIPNSESPSSPESFPSNSGTMQMTGTTIIAATTPNIVNTSTEMPHPTVAVSPTVSSTTNWNLLSTVSQGPAMDVEKTPATATKNALQNSATIAMKEGSTALSSGSVAAITVTVIFFVLLIFGGAAYLKIRHSSYGRLVDDHDYGSWGNYNNPLYDDS